MEERGGGGGRGRKGIEREGDGVEERWEGGGRGVEER